MKKFVALLLAMTLTLSLTACGGGKTAETTKDDTEGKTAVDILNLDKIVCSKNLTGFIELETIDDQLFDLGSFIHLAISNKTYHPAPLPHPSPRMFTMRTPCCALCCTSA